MSRVEKYYDKCAEIEWGRLASHRVEYGLTLLAFKEYLLRPPARIIDIGGACGRYSIELSRQGYNVTLVDVSSQCLKTARERAKAAGVQLQGYIHADARNLLDVDNESCDAALLMGPLYHLLEHKERLQAVNECWRVLKPGGLVFASFICRYNPFQDAAVKNPDYLMIRAEEAEEILRTGVYRKPENGGFIDSWFAHPRDIPPLMAAGNFSELALIAQESLVYCIEDRINSASDELHRKWLNLLYRIAHDPSIHGAAGHLLYIGRKL